MKNKPNIEHFNPIHAIEIDFDFGMSIADNIGESGGGGGLFDLYYMLYRYIYMGLWM